MKFDADGIHRWVLERAEPSYQAFSAALLPGVEDLAGVRLPILRRLAHSLAAEDAAYYVGEISNKTFEERMLRGLVIGYAKVGGDTRWAWVDAFLPSIDNWSICDSFCITLAGAMDREEAESVWPAIKAYAKSPQPFTARFAVVMTIDAYMQPERLDEVLSVLEAMRQSDYYVRMAVAWALATACAVSSYRTIRSLKDGKYDPWVLKKAVQKIGESRRVPSEDKAAARNILQKRSTR